jgi:hypothetical protein
MTAASHAAAVSGSLPRDPDSGEHADAILNLTVALARAATAPDGTTPVASAEQRP